MSVAVLTESWRRQECSQGCWRKPVLVIGERDKRVVEWHDEACWRAFLRPQAAGAPPTIRTGPLEIDRRTCTVLLNGEAVNLTPTEYRILSGLAERLGEVCPTPDILKRVWGPEYTRDAHLLRVNIARMRRQLRRARGLIQTCAGFGYLLQDIPPDGATPSSVAQAVAPRVPSSADFRWRQTGIGARQAVILESLRRAGGQRVSLESLTIAVYGMVTADYRYRTWLAISRLSLIRPCVHFESAERSRSGWGWLADPQP